MEQGEGINVENTDIVRDVDENEFKNMKLFIGPLGREAIFEASLSGGDSLNATRNIDIRLRQNNSGSPDQATGGAVAVAPDPHAPPAAGVAAPPPQAQGRLKITVAAEDDGADKDREYLDKMRGWLMAVATLFVNMAFQAILHPPDWFKTEWYSQTNKAGTGTESTDSLAAPAPTPSTHAAYATSGERRRAILYLLCNVVTFGIALTLAQVLLRETSSPRRTMGVVRAMMGMLSFCVACTFALGTSDNWFITGVVLLSVLMYAAIICLYYVPLANSREHCGTLFRRLV